MKLLLDTHILLWAVQGNSKLSPRAAQLINAPANELYFSAASIWEIAIKNGATRSGVGIDTERMRRLLLLNGYNELPITSAHGLAVENLPPIHRDPFDRLLFAQATLESMLLLTVDQNLIQYGPPVVAA